MMIDKADAATPKTRRFSRTRRWGGFFLRLICGLALMLIAPQIIVESCASILGKLGAAALGVAITIGVFLVFGRLTEGRWPGSFRAKQAPFELFAGVALGVMLSVTTVGGLWALGAYEVQSVAPSGEFVGILIAALPVPLLSGFAEELAIRGVITRQISRTFSPAAALVVSAILFGGIHLLNEGASIAIGLGLVIQAGLLLGAAYLLARRLWLPIGLHFGWNFMQAGVFGGALSGHRVHAIVSAAPRGADWLSGGLFGIEGSVVATLVCAAVAAGLLIAATRRGLAWWTPLSDDG